MVLFCRGLYLVVWSYGMVGAVVLILTTLVDDAVIICDALGGVGVFTLGGAGFSSLRAGYFCTALLSELGLFRWS